MKLHTFTKITALMLLALLSTAFASNATIEIDGDTVRWTNIDLEADASHFLRLSGPDGFMLTREFARGEAIGIGLSELPGDGLFSSELVVQPTVDPALLAQVRSGAASADLLPAQTVMTASFRLIDQAIPDALASEAGSMLKDQVFLDDVIVDGSLCVGFDCANGENFGFDTLRIKENNLRIHFDDTSASASFPANDWRILINDTTNGGSDHFSVQDSSAGRSPFRIEKAPANALVIEDTGDIGINTMNPVVELHMVDGDTPTVRLQQDGSAGFGQLTWDLAGNETNFFLRNVTNGSRLPFRVLPQAEDDQLVVGNGNTGLYTDNPRQDLHIRRNGDATIGLESFAAGDPDWTISNNGATDSFEISDTTDGNVSEDLDGAEFSLDASGNLTIAGLLVQNSNREAKHRITALEPSEVLDKVNDLTISQWQYKAMEGDHIGPMAQDFHATFGLGQDESKIATLDVAGVALVAIQGLTQEVAARDAQISRLEARLAELEANQAQQKQQQATIEAQQARLDRLEQMMLRPQTQRASLPRQHASADMMSLDSSE